jgi:hypothetical protein
MIGLIKDRLVYTYEGVVKENDLKSLAPFKIMKSGEQLYAGIPNNIESLVKTSYLYVAYIKSCDFNKIRMVAVDSDYQHMYSATPEREMFLKGLTSVIINNGLPNHKDAGNKHWFLGVGCAIHYMVKQIKNFKPELFNFGRVTTASTEYFGDPWGGKFKTEKRMLDSVLSCFQKIAINWGNLQTWRVSSQRIRERYRISEKLHENPVINEAERKWIVTDFNNELHAFEDVKFEAKWTTEKEYLDWQNHLFKSLKAFNQYKSFVDNLVDKRLKAVYSFGNKKKQRARKKVPIGELINAMKGTSEYLDTFNPMRGISTITPFHISDFPDKPESRTKFLTAVETHLRLEVGAGRCTQARAAYVLGWFVTAIPE